MSQTRPQDIQDLAQDLAATPDLPVDDHLFGLLREAILLRRRALELELGGCRQRVETIERRFGLPRSELAEAITSGTIEVPAAEARLWLTELLHVQKLQADIERLSQVRLVRRPSSVAGATGPMCPPTSSRRAPTPASPGQPAGMLSRTGSLPAQRRIRKLPPMTVSATIREEGDAIRPAA